MPEGGASRESGLDGYTVEWVEPGLVIVSRRECLYRASGVDGPFQPIGRFPAPAWKRWGARVRPVQRLLRHMFYNVVRLPDDSLFLTFGRSVGRLRRGKVELVDGLLRPCRVLRGGSAWEPASASIYFGEYLPNVARGPMHVYRLPLDGSRAEVAYRFPAGAIGHVHGVYYEPFQGGLWCTAGDRGGENRILFSPDGFRTVEMVGGGDETWRCVSLQFTPDAVYYGTDAEFTPNHIYRIDRRTGERRVVTAVEGPVYYSSAHGGSLFFGVTAELCPSQRGRRASLWRVCPDGSVERVFSTEKDRLDVTYFMPGTLDFPRGPGLPDRLFFHTTALDPDDCTFSVA